MTAIIPISTVIRRTVCLKFLTDAGKIYTVSINHASAKLAGTDGAALAKRAAEKILEVNPFRVKLVKAVSAELIERRVIYMADGGQDGAGSVRETAGAGPRMEDDAGGYGPSAGKIRGGRFIAPRRDIADAAGDMPARNTRSFTGSRNSGAYISVAAAKRLRTGNAVVLNGPFRRGIMMNAPPRA